MYLSATCTQTYILYTIYSHKSAPRARTHAHTQCIRLEQYKHNKPNNKIQIYEKEKETEKKKQEGFIVFILKYVDEYEYIYSYT